MRIRLSEHFTYKKLLLFTLPSVAMMTFTSLYGVVDGFFVSNFAGKTAFAAINLIMPILMTMGTFGFMLGAGGTALVAAKCGEGDGEEANRCFSLLTYTAVSAGALLALLGFLFMRPLSIALGASGELLECCVLYGRVISVAMPFYVLQVMFQSFFAAAEKPGLGLAITLLSGLTNMVLDVVFVTTFPVGYKLLGAALATALSQVVGGGIPLIYFIRKNTSRLRLGRTRVRGAVLARACLNGLSEFVTNVSANLVAILVNARLMQLAGENGVAAYGVTMYVAWIFTATLVGYTMGVAPIVSFHFGAGNCAELKNLKRKSLWVIGIAGLLMVGVAECFSAAFCAMFVGYDGELYRLTLNGFRIFAPGFAFMGFGIFTSGFFTALNDGLTSATISTLRTLVFHLVGLLVLPTLFGVFGVWYSPLAAEVLACAAGLYFLVTKEKKFHY